MKITSFVWIISIINTGLYGQLNQKPYDFESKISLWQKEYNVEFVAVGIVENGEAQFTEVFHQKSGNADSIQQMQFNAASLTKPVFGNAVLQLVDAGILGLDDRVYAYGLHTDIKNIEWHKRLSLRHILSHQSGLPNWRYMTLSGELDIYKEPGSRYTYSGEGFEYLREILDLRFKSTLNDYMDSLVFNPAGMSNTEITSAAGGMKTTIEDYTNFCRYMIAGAGISESLFNTMHQNQTYIKPGIYYGLGWEVVHDLDRNGSYTIMHSGAVPGVKNFVALFPKEKRGIVVFTQGGDNGLLIYEKIIRSFSELGNELFGSVNKQYAPKEQIVISQKRLQECVGKYQLNVSKSQVTFNLYIDNDNLRITLMGQDMLLFPVSRDVFIANESTSLRFVRNANNVIESVIIGQYGIDAFECDKLSVQKL